MHAALALRPGVVDRPPWARPALTLAALVAVVSIVLPDLRTPLRQVSTTVALRLTPSTIGGVRVEARTTSAGINVRWTGIADPDFDRWVLRRTDGRRSEIVAIERRPTPSRHLDPDGEPGRDSYLLVALDDDGRVLASSHVVVPLS